MKKIIVLLIAVLGIYTSHAQYSLRVQVKDGKSGEPVPGVTVTINAKTQTTDSSGFAILNNLPAGKQAVHFSHTGYEARTETIILPLAKDEVLEVRLEEAAEEMEEVVVQSTRTSRTIANTPTRVETIDGEELDEKSNMRPANVSMLLHESTGMQVQQTSATSANASIRVQGLDGRYTQLLKDGYPNFGNFASGLSVLEIPPLDLKQVEVIKGPASTLYGGGAIAGVVNFISKLPESRASYDLMFNTSHIGQTNIGLYASQKKGKIGYSLLGLVNFQKAYDVDKDDFSELPKSNSFTIHPRLFYYHDSSFYVMIGNSFTKGINTGGDMTVIKGRPDVYHVYFEKNRTIRNTTTLEAEKKLAGRKSVKLKQSVSLFDRHINMPGYEFYGQSTNSFTDLSLLVPVKEHTVIGGLNFIYDRFKQEVAGVHNARTTTIGGYLQDTWDATDRLKIESGLRVDHAAMQAVGFRQAHTFVLPRISVLFKLSNKISSRIGGGLGYKMPTIFTEQTESMQYRNIQPLRDVVAERSIGGTADINYKTKIGGNLLFSINQLFFYTQINKPLVLETIPAGGSAFVNASRPVVSSGFETNLKFIYRNDLKLFVGYTFTHAEARYLTGTQFLPLLPKHKLNLTLMYEKEDNFKLGLEGYFTGRQYLYNAYHTPSYWEFGFMAQKTFGKISFFVNFENFTDQRQSNYKSVANPPHNGPVFDDIWNHAEGFVVNGGIKLKL